MRRSVGLLAAVACVGLVLAVPGPAQAHSGLVDARPLPGDVVGPGVHVLALTFTDLHPDGPWQVSVTGPQEQLLLTGEPVLVGAATLCATVEPLSPGVHTIDYRVTPRDGHSARGRYLFEVAHDGPAMPRPEPCRGVDLPRPAAAPPPDDRPVWILLTGSVLVVVGAALAVAFAARRVRRARQGRPPGRS